MASLYPKAGYYYISYKEGGKRVQKSTGIRVSRRGRKMAEQKKRSIEDRLLKERLGFPVPKGIMEAGTEYLETTKLNLKPRTHERYRECLNSFTEFWMQHYPQRKLLHEITRNPVQRWVNHRLKMKRSPSTIHLELGTLISFLNYCVIQEWLPMNPINARDIKKPRKEQKTPRFFSHEELEIIFSKSPPHRSDLWKFLYYTGARIGEAAKLTVLNVGKERITFPVDISKGGREDTIPIAKNLRSVLERLCVGKGPEDLLFDDTDKWGRRFNNLRYEFQSFLKGKNLTHAVLHTFRHTAASHWVQNGVPLRIVMALMRHRDIKDTMVYAHLGPKDTAKYVDKLFM